MSEQIRKEYGWLAEETRYLVDTFGFALSQQAWRDHDLLMDGCECLDRLIDEAPDEIRSEKAKEVIAALRAGGSEGYNFTPELSQQIDTLVDIFGRYSEPEYFISRAARIFAIAEEIRSIEDRWLYIDRVCEEGRCFLEMFLPIFETSATSDFMVWFPNVAEVGNLVDKLVDARADFRRGEMKIQPGLLHHLVLLVECARRSRHAFKLFPKPTRLFIWAIRFFDPRRHISALS